MRAMNIRVITGSSGLTQLKASFKKNWKLYLMEALGLGIFMVSACFFGGMLEAKNSALHLAIPNAFARSLIMGVLMGCTALFIFYSPVTAPSGSHINPAVTITFLWLGKMCRWDAVFFIISQFLGGTVAVFIMAALMGGTLTESPVNYVCIVPGNTGIAAAAITEFIIAFVMVTMVLFTSANGSLKKYTRVFASCLVCIYVIVAGPVSGFGMNPARSFSSALPANTWTAFYIYIPVPVAGMLTAAKVFRLIKKKTALARNNQPAHNYPSINKSKALL